MIENALKYSEFGLKVIPVLGKIPAVHGWRKLATNDPQKLAELFKVKHTGIGLATGKSSMITVIDIDTKNGVNGFQTLENLGIELPSTVTVNTPTGGKHFYFQYDGRLCNVISAFFTSSGVDIKNDGGYVVMPYSLHPDGGEYEFESDQGLGEINIAKLPEEVVEEILDGKQKDKKKFKLPATILNGQRNQTLFKYASQLRFKGLEKEEILAELKTVNLERCNPPCTNEELLPIAESACRYEKGKEPLADDEVVYSDIYNAEVFTELMGDKIRWCRDYGGWFIYNGKIWENDKNDKIKKYGIETSKEIANRLRTLSRKANFKSNLNKIHSDAGINAMINCSKAFLGCLAENFDNRQYLFNCDNGTLDLNTNTFVDFKAEDLLTRKSNVIYDPNAKAPRWEQFLKEIFLDDNELIKYMQRVIGYSMTASTQEHCMFILYGHGRNGKNIFMEAIAGVLGDYALNCPSSMFVQKSTNGVPNDVARLKGARFVTASETNQNVNMDEELIKQLTGNKIITARFLNKEFFDFEATFKIFLATNHKPNIRGTDTGIWSRINMIPFRMTVTPETEDKQLDKKLLAEQSGIFNWMIEGYNQWREIGLKPPEVVREATQSYRDEEDDIGQFIKNECVIEKSGFIPVGEFRERFKLLNGYYKGSKTLSEYMIRKGFKFEGDNRVYYKGKQQRGYHGIRWITEMDITTDRGWSE